MTGVKLTYMSKRHSLIIGNQQNLTATCRAFSIAIKNGSQQQAAPLPGVRNGAAFIIGISYPENLNCSAHFIPCR